MVDESHDILKLLSCDYCGMKLPENGWEGIFEADHEYVHHQCVNSECCKEKWIKIDLGGFDPREWHKRKESEVIPSIDKKIYERE